MSAKKCAIILAIVFVIAALATFLLSRSYPTGKAVGIYYNGELIHTINTKNDGEYSVTEGGYNKVTVSGGRVFMSEADCPDKVCLRHGALRKNDAIVCVPNRVVVRAINDDAGIDAVTGR